MKTGVLLLLVLGGIAVATRGDILLEDNYNNGVLGTFLASDTLGGFNETSSDNSTGFTTESDSSARISSASNKNDFRGFLSNNKWGWASTGANHTLKTTWNISSSDLKDKASHMALVWQLDSGVSTAPEIGVMIDMNNTNAYMFSGSTNNHLGFAIDLNPNFGAPGEAFSIEVIFTETAFHISGSNGLFEGDEFFLGDWADSSLTDAETFYSRYSENDYYLGALVQGKGKEGLVVEVDSVTMEAIPEPAVITLIGLFGGGLIVLRRQFSK